MGFAQGAVGVVCGRLGGCSKASPQTLAERRIRTAAGCAHIDQAGGLWPGPQYDGLGAWGRRVEDAAKVGDPVHDPLHPTTRFDIAPLSFRCGEGQPSGRDDPNQEQRKHLAGHGPQPVSPAHASRSTGTART